MHKNKIPNLIVLVVSLFTTGAFAQSEVHRFESLVTDNDVDRIVYSNGYTMLAGSDFSMIGPYSGSGTLVNSATGISDPSFPKINGYIEAAVSDGQNGWYVGGYFDRIGDVVISNLAHINSDKTVDENWKPNPDNGIRKLAIEGSTLYVAGYFSKIAGQDRKYLAAFNLTNGDLTIWDPKPNDYVLAIQPDGDKVYIGGYFTAIGNPTQVTRNNIAAVNTSGTGTATNWIPVVNGSVQSLFVTAGTVYIGGYFNLAGGQARIGVAALNKANNLATSWNANLGSFQYVNSMALSSDGNTLYMGGYFTSVKGVARTHLAAVNANTGNVVLAWNPEINKDDYGVINDIKISGSTLYIAGYFSRVNSDDNPNRSGFAALSLSNPSLLQVWNPGASGEGAVVAFNSDNTQTFVGGYFNSVNAESRKQFALIEEATGKLWPFNINLEGIAYCMAVHNNILYIGGDFTLVNQLPRNNLAAFNLSTGALTNWSPSVGLSRGDNGDIRDMVIKDNLLYVAGRFSSITVDDNTLSRFGLAALNLTNGTPSSWDPMVGDGQSDQFPNSLNIVGNTVYVGGKFTLLGNQPHQFLAAVHATTGTPSNWAPDVTGEVYKVRAAGNEVYILGDFPKGIGGQLRPHGIAAIDATSGNPTTWNPEFVYRSGSQTILTDFALSPVDIYVSGAFDSINNVQGARPGLASFSLNTGNLNAWKPDIGFSNGRDKTPMVTAVAASNVRLFVGGTFGQLGTEDRNSYGEYDICPTVSSITLNGVTLTAPQADSYQWFANGHPVAGATSQIFEISILEYGIYGVEVILNGCVLRPEDKVYLITDAEKEISPVKIYPNPARDELFIEVPSPSTLTVVDMLGKPVLKSDLSFYERNRIETSSLRNGAYILQIRTERKTRTFKILKTY